MDRKDKEKSPLLFNDNYPMAGIAPAPTTVTALGTGAYSFFDNNIDDDFSMTMIWMMTMISNYKLNVDGTNTFFFAFVFRDGF
jgi:hypothetical protein